MSRCFRLLRCASGGDRTRRTALPEGVGIEQIGHQHPHPTTGRDIANQTHGRGLADDFVGLALACTRRAQCDDALGLPRAHEIAHAVPACGIDADAEGQPALSQGREMDVAGVAPVEHQQIASGFEPIERFKQHLPFAAIGRMQARTQGQFHARQIEGEGPMVVRQFGTLARADAQSGSIGSDHAQPLPASGLDPCGQLFEQLRIEAIEDPRREAAPSLTERAVADFSPAPRFAGERGEEAIEFGLRARTQA